MREDWFLGTVKAVLAAIAGGLAWLFGGLDDLFIVLLIMVAIDYITGVIAAAINGSLSSDVGFKGLLKKGCILLVLIIAVQLDKLVSGGVMLFRTLVCLFYIANEGLSIIENLGKVGLPLPEKLKDALKALRDKADEREAITDLQMVEEGTGMVIEKPPNEGHLQPGGYAPGPWNGAVPTPNELPQEEEKNEDQD